MTLEEYAKKILTDAGCNEYTYGGKWADKLLDDLKKAFKPEEMEYPYVDVANAILSMSRPNPIKRAPWKMIWNMPDCIDGEDCESFEDAKDAALHTYEIWMEGFEWSNPPTWEKVDEWNYMIGEHFCWIEYYDPKTDEYEGEYWIPDEELAEIGWKELTLKEAQKIFEDMRGKA